LIDWQFLIGPGSHSWRSVPAILEKNMVDVGGKKIEKKKKNAKQKLTLGPLEGRELGADIANRGVGLVLAALSLDRVRLAGVLRRCVARARRGPPVL
jgi:hypothetical protein